MFYSTFLQLALLFFITLWLDNVMLEYLLWILPIEYKLHEVCLAHCYLPIPWKDVQYIIDDQQIRVE